MSDDINRSAPVEWSLRAYLLLTFAFVFAPIAASFVFSFNVDRFPSLPLGGFSLTWYQQVAADPLVWEGLRNTLVANLSSQLPGWVVASQPLGSDQDTLNVTVTGFHGRYDGAVVISGEWLLNHQGQLIKRPFHLELKQQKDGYDEMVKVLAQGWAQESASIAREISRLP